MKQRLSTSVQMDMKDRHPPPPSPFESGNRGIPGTKTEGQGIVLGSTCGREQKFLSKKLWRNENFFLPLHPQNQGEVLEWLKRHAWKACKRQKRFTSSNLVLSAENPRKFRMGFGDFFVVTPQSLRSVHRGSSSPPCW